MQAGETDRAAKASANPFRVALVCMPFHIAIRPSIQISLLQAIAAQAGFDADSYHLNLELAARLSPDVYNALCRNHHNSLCEWLFSIAAFGEDVSTDDEQYFAAFPEVTRWIQKLGEQAGFLSELRHVGLPGFIQDCLKLVEWDRYQVVGFTSTFQQNVASLALARQLKGRYPGLPIVFGGANMDDPMGPEYLRAFPWIDYVVVGEADEVFPELLRCLADGQPPDGRPGLAWRRGNEVRYSGQAPPFTHLDALPAPIYDDYFDRVKRLGLRGQRPAYGTTIPFESSRGCWWGQKHHCTFCGFNRQGLAYRTKSPSRVLAELDQLARTYRITTFEACDAILDPGYLKQFFPAICESRTDYQFYYESKANLTRQQIRTLYQGGVRILQPGIESLSSHVLGLMRKGCSLLQNVRTLKWCRYYRMGVAWNLLWGFPGETAEDYASQLVVLRLLSHLEPPGNWGRIWLERFSPYFDHPQDFPLRQVQPQASYAYVYPPSLDLEQVAYFFDYQMDETLPESAHQETVAWLEEWKRRWLSPRPDTLFYRRTRDSLFIDDNRGAERCGSYALDGPLAVLYEYCGETMRTVSQAAEYLAAAPEGYEYPPDQVQAALDRFCQLGLMLGEEGRYLSLALPANPNW